MATASSDLAKAKTQNNAFFGSSLLRFASVRKEDVASGTLLAAFCGPVLRSERIAEVCAGVRRGGEAVEAGEPANPAGQG